jgi:hypothetical protein
MQTRSILPRAFSDAHSHLATCALSVMIAIVNDGE